MRTDYAEAVLDVACLVPPGRVLSYGDVAELLGAGGPRQVGASMAGSGGAAPWWRIVRADGSLPPALQEEAAPRWAAEGTPRRGGRVDMACARWAPGRDGLAAVAAIADRLVPVPDRLAPAPNRRRPVVP